MERALGKITEFGKYLSLLSICFISVLTFISVVGRFFKYPILGDIELVQLAMVVLIMGGLAYTQEKEDHIAVDILVNKFPIKIQVILDLVSKFLIMLMAFLIAYIYFQVFLKHLNVTVVKTTLLGIVQYPFDLIIVLGFFTWGLQAAIQFIIGIKKLKIGDR
jgi:TRAP-type C4-dicarboxylate transport system permease small subunit